MSESAGTERQMAVREGLARRPRLSLPLVYSCSGCSSAAQMTNWLAVRLDRTGMAEMSCVAGVGGDVASLVRKASSSRPLITIDGCVLQCAASCLRRHGIEPDLPVLLSDSGVRKRLGEDFDLGEATRVLADLTDEVQHRFGSQPEQSVAQ